ncbi:protein of unknown function (plasmid) [Pararobbsia alpina]
MCVSSVVQRPKHPLIRVDEALGEADYFLFGRQQHNALRVLVHWVTSQRTRNIRCA